VFLSADSGPFFCKRMFLCCVHHRLRHTGIYTYSVYSGPNPVLSHQKVRCHRVRSLVQLASCTLRLPIYHVNVATITNYKLDHHHQHEHHSSPQAILHVVGTPCKAFKKFERQRSKAVTTPPTLPPPGLYRTTTPSYLLEHIIISTHSARVMSALRFRDRRPS
jgi:hypothetical protein